MGKSETGREREPVQVERCWCPNKGGGLRRGEGQRLLERGR